MSSSRSTSSCSSSVATSARASLFDIGNYETILLDIKSSKDTSEPPPKPLLIGTPSGSHGGGVFPVVLVLHGYLLYNHFYSQLLHHIASHGFVVIAPQLYTVAGPDSSEEIKATAAIIAWLPKALQHVLPPNIQPNLQKLALSGHSRGGKVTFALALGKEATSPLKVSTLIGIDPVDGMDKSSQTPPPVLTYVPCSFDLDHMPVMLVGSGLGPVKRNPLFPACAPKGVNHEDFYNECQDPAWHFVVKDYGHLDMLDDETKGIRGRSSYCLCKDGKAREPMRRFVGGVMVAFLNAYLNGDDSGLIAIRDGSVEIPVGFDKVEFRVRDLKCN